MFSTTEVLKDNAYVGTAQYLKVESLVGLGMKRKGIMYMSSSFQ